MWKKFLMACVCLFGALSITTVLNGKALQNDLYASSGMTAYNMPFLSTVKLANSDWKVIANGFSGKKAPVGDLTLLKDASMTTMYAHSSGTVYYGATNLSNYLKTNIDNNLTTDEKVIIKPVSVFDPSNKMAYENAVSATGTNDVYTYALSATEAGYTGEKVTSQWTAAPYNHTGSGYYFNSVAERNSAMGLKNDSTYVWSRSPRVHTATTGYRIALVLFTQNGMAGGNTNEVAGNVMPALQLYKEKISLASDLSDSQRSLHGGQLQAVDQKGMNLLVHDSSLDFKLANDQAALVELKKNAPNKTISVKYDTSSFSPAANRFITAVVSVEQNGKEAVVYAGRVEDASASVDGDVKVNFDGVDTSKTYKLRFFVEDLNGAYHKSSLVSDPIAITFLNDASISYQPQPQNQATYQYRVNVEETELIGKISVADAKAPVTYEVSGYDDIAQGHENDYQNFELTNETDTSADVIIKQTGAPDVSPHTKHLQAKTYYFQVKATDAIGDEKISKVEVVVERASPAIAFSDPNEKKISSQDAFAGWKETASVTDFLGDEQEITYTITGGDINLISIEADGTLKLKSEDSFGKAEITATVNDKSGSSFDNYNEVSVKKEIVVYREVTGTITPDSASSDTDLPTFTADDTNVKIGGVIGTVVGSKGTPDMIGGSTTTYTYGLKAGGDSNYFAVDSSSGQITSKVNLGIGSFTFTVTVSDQWSTEEIEVTVNVGIAQAEELKFYESSESATVITSKSVALTDTGVVLNARVLNSSNTNPVKYSIKDGSSNIALVHQTNGALTLKGVGTVAVIAEKDGANGQANARAELKLTVTQGIQSFMYTDHAKNELKKTGTKYDALKETYEANHTFQLYTDGSPSSADVTYALKAGSPADVIRIDPDGKVHLLNASKSDQMGRVIAVATSKDPSGNYQDASIELPINIEKGTRAVSFADDPIYVSSGTGSITPVVKVDGVIDTEGNPLIEVDADEDSSIAWTEDNQSIHYDYTAETAKEIKLHVTKPADRNYKVAEAEGILHIMGEDENALAITSPGRIIYGDHFTIRSTQFDDDSTNVAYMFETDNQTFISPPQANGNKAEFDAIQFSGNTATVITVTRTADGEVPLSKKVSVRVLPKEITVDIDDKEKLKGEGNPALTYQDFTSQLVSWNGTRDIIQPTDVKLSTTAITGSDAGTYPITGDSAVLNQTYPNYTFKFLEGNLVVREEAVEDDWFHLELEDEKQTAYHGEWTNQNVNIVTGHPEYVKLSTDQSTWNAGSVTISQEGELDQSFWMKKANGATTAEKRVSIRIDQTAPHVVKISAKDSNHLLQDLIHQLSGGIFFQPGTTLEIITSDEHHVLEVSGTSKLAYKLYKKENGSYGDAIREDTISVNKEQGSVRLDQTTGTYQICMTLEDEAGNQSEEACREITLKKLNVDVDKDGKPDFNDPDGDGCPDLNIVLDKNADGDWIKLNEERNGDHLPELNIDTDGDGQADINVDQDGDGIPDLNIVKVTEWKPDYCVVGQAEEYCTDQTLIPNINVDINNDQRPDLNIDLNNDGIPDIDIDTDGDGKPDINIDTNRDGTPDKSILKLTEWKINERVFEVDGVRYQTMTGLEPDSVDRIEDNGIIAEPGAGGTLLPNYALKVTDVTEQEKTNVKEKASDLIGEQEIKKVYDVKLLEDNVETQPNGKLKVRVPIPEGVRNPVLLVKNSDGTYKRVNASIENGYMIYETDELGQVSVIGDKEESKAPVQPSTKSQTSVKGSYSGSMGGALTGDSTSLSLQIFFLIISLSTILLLKKKNQHS